MNYCCWLLLLIFSLVTIPVYAVDREQIIQQHDAIQKQLQYFRCQFRVENDLPTAGYPKVLTGQFFKSPKLIYISAKGGSIDTQILIRQDKTEQHGNYIHPVTKKSAGMMSISATRVAQLDADPFFSLRYSFEPTRSPDKTRTLRQMLESNCRPDYAVDNDSITFAMLNTNGHVKLSRSENYFVTQVKSISTRQNGYESSAIVDVSEFVPTLAGFSLPTLSSEKSMSNGKLIYSKKTKISQIDLTPFDDSNFQIKITQTTTVKDRITGKTYQLDPASQQIGEIKTYSPRIPRPKGPETASSQPTQEEDSRFGWWLLPLGICVVLACLGLIVFKRFRTPRN